MSSLTEYSFNSVYGFADLIDKMVRYDYELFNHDEDFFLESSAKFSKLTVLHHYIVCSLFNHFDKQFRTNGDFFEEHELDKWYELFSIHSIEIMPFDFENTDLEIYNWFETHSDQFQKIFELISDEVFHVLFSNRGFLLRFNNLITTTVKELEYPQSFLNKKGRIKRVSIPQWVKNAVFHRDKGRCVFCNTDLTLMINTLTNANYDHIVPLDRFGINDPCNIQLCCEKCNKSKTNKEGNTSSYYFSWW